MMEELQQRAEGLDQLVQRSRGWVGSCCSPEETRSKLEKLAHIGREARLMQRIAGRRTSIFLFGLSQAGKSYLVHTMTSSPETGRLIIELGGQKVDFLSEMNPAGGRESTGFATRFTVRDENADAQFPVEATLLGVMDVASIIANSYFQDIQDYNFAISEDQVRARLEHAQSVAGSEEARNGVGVDDVAWFVEYVTRSFKDAKWVGKLTEWGYWEVLVRLAPYLKLKELIALVEVVWGELPFWTKYFREQCSALETTGFASQVFMEVASVRPQTETVLDVQRLRDIFEGTEWGGVKLKADGREVSLERGALSALIREVVLPVSPLLAKDERSFMEVVDVLDFPGARSRKKMDQSVFEANDDPTNAELIIRGKVGYLFDLYNREMGIGAMVYCLDHNQAEVQDVPKLVHDWIARAIGPTPELRAQRQMKLAEDASMGQSKVTPLLVALTKFDVTMQGNQEPLGNSKVHDPRWSARFKSNFQDWLQAPVEDKWIENWDGAAFQQVFPIRNPQYSGTFMESDATGGELRVRPEQMQRMNETGQSFTAHSDVRRFISKPAECWEELMKPNGSGARLLLDALANAAQPSIQHRQVEGRLDTLKAELDALMRPMYISGDHAENLKVARQKSAGVFMALAGMRVQAPDVLSRWMKANFLTEGEARTAYYQAYESFGSPAGEPESEPTMTLWQVALGMNVPVTEGDTISTLVTAIANVLALGEQETRNMLEQQYGPDILVAPSGGDTGQKVSLNTSVAEFVISSWISKVRRNADTDNLNGLGIPFAQHVHFQELATGLIEGRIRDGLKERLETFLILDREQVPSRESALRTAMGATAIINRYTRSFGMENGPLFDTSDPNIEEALPPLLKEPRDASPFLHDWSRAAKGCFEANLVYEQGHMDEHKLKCNVELKGLLDDVEVG